MVVGERNRAKPCPTCAAGNTSLFGYKASQPCFSLVCVSGWVFRVRLIVVSQVLLAGPAIRVWLRTPGLRLGPGVALCRARLREVA